MTDVPAARGRIAHRKIREAMAATAWAIEACQEWPEAIPEVTFASLASAHDSLITARAALARHYSEKGIR